MQWHFLPMAWGLWFFVWALAAFAFCLSDKGLGSLSRSVKTLGEIISQIRKRGGPANVVLSRAIEFSIVAIVVLFLLFMTPLAILVSLASAFMKLK
jgi:hypothetical protein